jgi:cell wall-associated NlpC family hydrolase
LKDIGKNKVVFKGKLKMRKLKRLSVTLFIAPFLFVGCVSEKTSSLKPKVTKEKTATLENNQSISKEEKLLASAIFGGEIPTDEKNPNEILTTQTFSLSKVWEDFTKEDEILETARIFLGVKYIWAANGPSAFDCSGFTKYVFKESGISLPRYSGHQANVGKKIKFSEMKKGDLVFFDTTKKFRKKVNHVGIFIGDNKFIHASSAKKKVVITSFSKKKFYKNKFLHARRVVSTNESFTLNRSSTKKDTLVN